MLVLNVFWFHPSDRHNSSLAFVVCVCGMLAELLAVAWETGSEAVWCLYTHKYLIL